MPSWNIHTAHAEHLLDDPGAQSLGIRDVDAFLLGNLLPDVYVGYMVKNITRKIKYAETHLADPNFVPEPDYGLFFKRYGTPDADGQVSDLILGSWAHLVADHDYNKHVNEFLVAHDIKPCTETRIRKQADFDLFGRTLNITRAPQITPQVLKQCESYAPYELYPSDMFNTQAAMEAIIVDNAVRHVDGAPDYQMLGADFFAETFDAVTNHIRSGLAAYAAGDPLWGAER